MTHSQMQELLPLYALDALPDDEDVELRIHVETCQECAQVLQNYLETAGLLATAADPVTPSPALKTRILQEVRTPAMAPAAPESRSNPFRRWFPAAAVAAFVAIASFSAVLVRRIEDQNARLGESQRLLTLASSPGVEVVPLKSTPEGRGASGRVFVDPGRKVSGMVVSGLSDPEDKIYALWVIEAGNPKLVENFKPDDSGTAVMVLDSEVGDYRPVAVTLEDRPNTRAPEGPAVLSL